MRSTTRPRLAVLSFEVAGVSPAIAGDPSFPATEISVVRQSEMVTNHCVRCHMDNARNGGLSLEGFDPADVSAPLAAMLVSKFTMGVPLDEILKPAIDPAGVCWYFA